MSDNLLELTRLLLAIFVIRSPAIRCRWLGLSAGFVHSWLVNFSARWKEQLSFLFSDLDLASFYVTVVEKGKLGGFKTTNDLYSAIFWYCLRHLLENFVLHKLPDKLEMAKS